MRARNPIGSLGLVLACGFLIAGEPPPEALEPVPQAPFGIAPDGLVWSPDGRFLAKGGAGITIHDVETGRIRARFAPEESTRSVRWSADGERVSAVGVRAGAIREWEVRTGREVGILTQGERVRHPTMEYSPDGTRYVVFETDAVLHDAATGAVIARTMGSRASFSPDGQRMVVVHPWKATLVDARTGEELGTLGQEAIPGDNHQTRHATSITWSLEGERVALWQYSRHRGDAHRIEVFDGRTAEVVADLSFEPQTLRDVTFGLEPDHLYAWGGGRVDVWQLPGGERSTLLESEDIVDVALDRVSGRAAVLLSPREKPIFTPPNLFRDLSRIELWNPASGEVTTLPGTGTCVSGSGGLAWSPDGRTLARWDHVGHMVLWDVETGNSRRMLAGLGWRTSRVRFSPDGSRVAVGADYNKAEAWDLASSRLLGVYDTGASLLSDLAWSPDGRQLAVAAGNVVLWDPVRDEVSLEFDLDAAPASLDSSTYQGEMWTRARRVLFAPDGESLITVRAWDRGIAVWDVRSGELRGMLGPGSTDDEAPTGHLREVHELSLSPDGRWLASGSADGVTLGWEVGGLRDPGTQAPVALGTLRSTTARQTWASDSQRLILIDGRRKVHEVTMEGGATREVAELDLHAAASFVRDDTLLMLDVPRKEPRLPHLVQLDLATGERKSLREIPHLIGPAEFHPDGDLLAIAGAGLGLVRLADGASITLRAVPTADGWTTVTTTPDGRFDGDPAGFDQLFFADPSADLMERPLIPGSQVVDRFHAPGLYAAEGFAAAGDSP